MNSNEILWIVVHSINVNKYRLTMKYEASMLSFKKRKVIADFHLLNVKWIFAGDLFGQLLAWISLAPMGIGAGFVTLILFRRDLHTVSFHKFPYHSVSVNCHRYLCCSDVSFYQCHWGKFIIINCYLFCVFQIAFFIGTLVNEVSNIILKHWIREPRPINRLHIGTEFGMPSSHSQFIWFFSTYVTLFIFIRYATTFVDFSSLSFDVYACLAISIVFDQFSVDI